MTSDDNVQTVLAKPYARRLVPDENGGYAASILEFPGCFAEGDTPDEAMQNLNDAAEAWVEAMLSMGREIREPIALYGHSGKIALRIPRSLHQQSVEMAEIDQTSLNQFFLHAISAHVSGRSTQTVHVVMHQALARPAAIVEHFGQISAPAGDWLQRMGSTISDGVTVKQLALAQ